MDYRIEHDSMGEMKVPKDKYWGAQTQRSLENFPIGEEKMPSEVIQGMAILKKAAAITNNKLGKLDKERMELISQVCDEILAGKLSSHFPLVVWQTGSGTQSNMNVNEVIKNRGNEIAGKEILHANDHVNMSQSSNDTFPTAMHIAASRSIQNNLIPAIQKFLEVLEALMEENEGIIKIGRTHLQDATPIKFSQEISGWHRMLENNLKTIEESAKSLRELALGGTAVGTGLNAPENYAEEVAVEISKISEMEFTTAKNKFHSLTSKDSLVYVHGALTALAANLMKIANDVRWLASGPRCGLGEITIPANEPGSSIMPGKVNPTQAEALTMVSVQVMSNHHAISFAASQGNFELNAFMPVLIYNFLQSVRLLADAINSFNLRCVSGLKANSKRMSKYLNESLMLVTSLNTHIGYENAAKIAQLAHKENTSLKEAALKLNLLSEEEFDQFCRPELMV